MAGALRVGVGGRVGAGRRTVARALSRAGVSVADPSADAEVMVYVFVETLTIDDYAALGSLARPTVAVLNKADLTGFADDGPLAVCADRCRTLRRQTAVPVVPLSALLAVAGTAPEALDEQALAGLRALARGAVPDAPVRQRLATDLDVVGTALAVGALRDGADRSAVAGLLRAVSGIDEVLTQIDRAGAPIRYRRAAGPARTADAGAVLDAAGAPAPRHADPLAGAVHWHRYARGPVSPLHRACAMDLARDAMRRWVRAGGRPAALP
jgi:hypothetical protein